MTNSLRFVLFLAGIVAVPRLFAQAIPDTVTARQSFMVEAGGLGSSSRQTPFWFRSRQYGTVPLTGPAGIVRLGLTRQFGDLQRIHSKVAVEGVANVGSSSQLILPVAYASLLSRNFELYLGRKREVFGLVDTLLSMGSYAWSGNALPVYKLQLGTRGYVPLGFTKGVVALNGMYAHGWFSNTDSIQNSFLHQKALFFRFNLFHNRVRLYGGVTHFAQWGGRSNIYKDGITVKGRIPSSLATYKDIILVRQPPSDTTQYSRFDLENQAGNHLGSIDVAMEIDNPQANWYLYYQHPFEDKSGVAFQNMPDGLYGIRWKNKWIDGHRGFIIRQLTVEFLTTLNQTGFNFNIGNRLYNGADDYFNNYQYVDGWTHQQRVIGTPFFTRLMDSRDDLHNLKGGHKNKGPLMISNNRVQVGHLGILGEWPSGVQLRALLSYSRNLGRPISSDPRTPLTQFSGMAQLMLPVSWLGGAQLNLAVALDQGQWLTNSLGGWLSLRKIIQKR
ncbi:capsule assembly Wzi family protein [Spirosoma fluviale]|uniref:Capsule assembly protein Wzi n=1 Tax=Spirosoma fluviale TaxID=1597977 RepID=A0A286G8G5_9BACT|nr:capsule assembly Wzi family protein [Spirosoma fluviale]SOD91833.1 Capsule assembly protein Wzi [Spirosoma fluviale]